MLLRIKVLKGDECEVQVHRNPPIPRDLRFHHNPSHRLQVADTTTVAELKQQIEQLLHIPVAHQSLLNVGHPLIDRRTLAEYAPKIRDGTKLTLVVKEPPALRDVMHKVFAKGYADDDAQRMAGELLADQRKRVEALSLDDLERLAGFFLARSSLGAGEAAAAATAVKSETALKSET